MVTMEETRVSKYKDYRDSFTKADAQDINGVDDIISGLSNHEDFSSTTNTLPIDEVIKEVDIQDKADEESRDRIRKQFNFKLVIGIAVATLLIASIIVVGIFLFRR